MSKRDKIKKELEKEENEVYGDEAPGGSAGTQQEDFADTDDPMESVVGNKPQGTLAEEIDKDEKSR